MIKLTVLALFVALQQGISAEKDTSRRLLQYPQAAYFCGHPCDPSPSNQCGNSQQCWMAYQAAANPAPAPAVNTPVVNTPAVNTPAVNTPAVDPPAANTPAVNPPAVNTPAVNTPPQVGGPQVGGPQVGGPQVGGPQVVTPVYPIPGGAPPAFTPYVYTPPLTEAECTGVTPMGTPAVPGTATSCQGRRACPPGAAAAAAAGAPPCAGPMAYNNMANNFKLYCSAPSGCSNSEINMNFGPMQGVRSINQLLFSEAGAGAGSVVNVRNDQNIGNVITIERLECSAPGSCQGLEINMWGASMNDVDCSYPQNCGGCTINLWTQQPSPACPNPADAPANRGCLIETAPCYGW